MQNADHIVFAVARGDANDRDVPAEIFAYPFDHTLGRPVGKHPVDDEKIESLALEALQKVRNRSEEFALVLDRRKQQPVNSYLIFVVFKNAYTHEMMKFRKLAAASERGLRRFKINTIDHVRQGICLVSSIQAVFRIKIRDECLKMRSYTKVV